MSKHTIFLILIACITLMCTPSCQRGTSSSKQVHYEQDDMSYDELENSNGQRPSSVYGYVYDVVIGSFTDPSITDDFVQQMKREGVENIFCEECFAKGEWITRVIAFTSINKERAIQEKQYLADCGITAWIWNHYVDQPSQVCTSQRTTHSKCNVFTCVYSTAYDHYTNLRSAPSDNAPIVGRLNEIMHGNAGDGVLLETCGEWYKIDLYGTIGYAYSRYVGLSSWYSGDLKYVIVANKPQTPIYYDYGSDDDDELPVFRVVPKGTIITDIASKKEADGEFYNLITAHDGLLVMMSDCKIVKAEDL